MKILKNYNFLDVATNLEKRLYEKLLNSSFFRDKIEFIHKNDIKFLYDKNILHLQDSFNINEYFLKDPVVISIYKNSSNASISKGNTFLKQIMDNDLINYVPIICLLEKNEPIGNSSKSISITLLNINTNDIFQDFLDNNILFKYEKFSTIFKDSNEN